MTRSLHAISVLVLLFLCVTLTAFSSSAFAPISNQQKSLNSTSMSPREHSSESASQDGSLIRPQAGKLEELKQREQALTRLLEAVRQEKMEALRSKPLTIGIIGFGRFGQFMAQTFVKHGRVIVTSRTDYSDVAAGMGVKYIPLSNPAAFLDENLDVVIISTSIVSFKETLSSFASDLIDHEEKCRKDKMDLNDPLLAIQSLSRKRLPLIVDVLSVKEHPREIMLDILPVDCDVLCSHPMFGPDSGKYSWEGLNFVYERTRINGVRSDDTSLSMDQLREIKASQEYIERLDRMERFLSIWEEEGCRMVELPCKDHDSYAANSQFITHLMGRILGEQGLQSTPIDTKGFESVLKLVGSTTADSFELFYGLYKYNQNSLDTIIKLRSSMDDVVKKLNEMENNTI